MEDQVVGVFSDCLDTVRAIQTKHGVVSFVSDQGLGFVPNEDRVFIDTQAHIFGVADGMGAYSKSDEAAQILSEEILEGIKSSIDPASIQVMASQRMKRNGIGEGGACYLSVQITQENVLIVYAGDVALVIVNDRGDRVHATLDTYIEHAPRGNSPGKASVDAVRIADYDTLIIGSDGLWDNIDKRDTHDLVKSMKKGETDVLLKKLFYFAKSNMKRTFMTTYDGMSETRKLKPGKEDNISIVVFQKLPKENE